MRDEEALCVEAVSLSWELVQGLSTNANDFWPALKGFISTAFHHKLLQLTQAQSPTLAATLKQVIHLTVGKEARQKFGLWKCNFNNEILIFVVSVFVFRSPVI